MKKPLKTIIVGAGHRSALYASYALAEPQDMKITGVADPNPVRRRMIQEKYGFGDDMCFETAEQLAEHDKLADVIINGTMDNLHVPTTTLLLKKGYDVLLEKPFAVNEKEMRQLQETVAQCGRRVMICHVLRYTPFYRAVKKHVMNGEIGEIINIQMTEHVSYHHMAVSYVRGKWASEKECFAPMLLAKSCHDIDLMMWMMEGDKPVSVASFGSDYQFVTEKKPSGAGSRCLVNCPIESDCVFSARRNYLQPPYRWGFYVWEGLEGTEPGMKEKDQSLKGGNPYGRCVWDCKRDGNVDHQSVLFYFASGATGTFNMIGGSAKPERNIHIIGTKGEIKGTFESSAYSIRKLVPEAENGFEETVFDLNIQGDKTGEKGGHGGGDILVPQDFVKLVRGEETSFSCTSLDTSILGHLAVFRAEVARKEKSVVTLD